jgi:hypothetical protein
VKNKNAEDFKEEFPEAHESILYHHYVDDFIQSFPTEKEAIKVSNEVVLVHKRGEFKLRNFVSNSLRVQEALSSDPGKVTVNLDKDQKVINSQKVLGLYFTDKDVYIFRNNYLEKSNLNAEKCPTKRKFLSLLMSVYDPFGFIANFVIHEKILLAQKIESLLREKPYRSLDWSCKDSCWGSDG